MRIRRGPATVTGEARRTRATRAQPLGRTTRPGKARRVGPGARRPASDRKPDTPSWKGVAHMHRRSSSPGRRARRVVPRACRIAGARRAGHRQRARRRRRAARSFDATASRPTRRPFSHGRRARAPVRRHERRRRRARSPARRAAPRSRPRAPTRGSTPATSARSAAVVRRRSTASDGDVRPDDGPVPAPTYKNGAFAAVGACGDPIASGRRRPRSPARRPRLLELHDLAARAAPATCGRRRRTVDGRACSTATARATPVARRDGRAAARSRSRPAPTVSATRDARDGPDERCEATKRGRRSASERARRRRARRRTAPAVAARRRPRRRRR